MEMLKKEEEEEEGDSVDRYTVEIAKKMER